MLKTLTTFMLLMVTTVAFADSTTKSVDDRLTALENQSLSLPNGLYFNGEIEGFYDDKTYDSGWDSRAELQVGASSDLDLPLVNKAGASVSFDSHYSLDTTKNNTLVEKQMFVGNDNFRLFMGETDAQRLGFAKTSKIGAPIIITKPNNRLDHNEKTVLAVGGFVWNDEFQMESYRLQKDKPWGIVVGFDNDKDTYYYNGTVSVMGLADVSYMVIDTPSDAAGYSKDTKQEGFAVGGSLRRWGVPVQWGAEMWDDKDTGAQAGKNRYDYGMMWNTTENTYLTAHRTENDDLGYTGNYYGAVYDNKVTEVGLYFHDKGGVSTFTGADYTDTQQVLASIKYKF